MEQRKALYEKRKLVSAFVEAAGTFIENPVKDKTWAEIEETRKELNTIKNRVEAYINDIDNFLMQEATNWQEQWDLAFAIFDEESKKEHNNVEKLTKNLVVRGLNEELAASVAKKLVNPDEEES